MGRTTDDPLEELRRVRRGEHVLISGGDNTPSGEYTVTDVQEDPHSDVRIAGITAPFIAELRTGSGQTIRVGAATPTRCRVERIRQVVNHEGHVLYHVVDGEGDRQWLVYDGVEAELTRERSGFRGAKRRER